MMLSPRWALIPTVLAGWFLAAGPLIALTPEVKDEGGFFSAAAIRQANEVIREIQKKHKKDLLIETFRTAPASRLREFREAKDGAKSRLFLNWAEDRVRTTGVEGVYILLCKDPKFLVVEIARETQKKAFTPADRDELRSLLNLRLNNGEYDQALGEAVRFVRARFDKNLPAESPQPVTPPVSEPVHDTAGFFSPGAVQKAGAVLRELKNELRQPARIETFSSPPADKAEQLRKLTELKEKPAREREHIFDAWLEERIAASHEDGIHVLIVREPGHVHINMGPETRKKAFLAEDRDKLRDLLVKAFKAKEYDKGLLEGVEFIQTTVRSHLKPSAGGGGIPSASKPGPALPSGADKSSVAEKPATPADKGDAVEGPRLPMRAATVAGRRPDPDASGEAAEKGKSKGGFIDFAGGKSVDAASAGAVSDMPATPTAVTPTSSFNWMWVVWGVVIVVGVWMLIGLIRSLTGSTNRRAMEQTRSPAYGGGPGPQPGSPYAGGRAVPPPLPGAGGPQGGYPPGGYQAGYPAGGYPPAPPPSGGGGGFMTGMLGGMFGAAAGSWIYDRFARGSSHSSGGWGTARAAEPPQPGERTSSPSAGAAAGGFGSAGGEYNDPAAAGGSFGSAGGDFGEPNEPGADFGSAGGEYGAPPDTGGGGDFGAEDAGTNSAGGDFGSVGGDSAGGDLGGENSGADDSASGDFGGESDSGGGDFGGGDSGGGDSGGSDGGDF